MFVWLDKKGDMTKLTLFFGHLTRKTLNDRKKTGCGHVVPIARVFEIVGLKIKLLSNNPETRGATKVSHPLFMAWLRLHGVASMLCFRLTEGNKLKNQRFNVVWGEIWSATPFCKVIIVNVSLHVIPLEVESVSVKPLNNTLCCSVTLQLVV